MCIEIEIETYLSMLEQRRENVKNWFGWEIPDEVWGLALDVIRECGIDPKHADPSYVVDNLVVNSEWYEFDDVRCPSETDEEIVERWEDECLAIDLENKIILVSF